MKAKSENMLMGAAAGLAVGAAGGAACSYMAVKHPREMKNAMKKASHSAEKAMQSLERMLQSR